MDIIKQEAKKLQAIVIAANKKVKSYSAKIYGCKDIYEKAKKAGYK